MIFLTNKIIFYKISFFQFRGVAFFKILNYTYSKS